MVWSGGNYNKGNNATGGWTGDASLGIGIEAGRHDTQDNDFATGINQCLNKDGSNAATGNLNDGGFRHTNLGAATARTDAPQVAQVQDGSFVWCGTSGGTANAQTLTPSPPITAYAAGQMFRFIAGFTSTGALTLQVSGISGPITCLMKKSKVAFGAISGSVLLSGITYEALYDGTNFLISDLLDFSNYTNDPGAARLKLLKSRGTTAGTNTIVQNGDSLGQIDFYGASGSEYTRGAYINATVSGTPGATNDMPTSLVFATTPEGSGTPIERMRIADGGVLLINRTSSVGGAVIAAGSGIGQQVISIDGGTSGTGAGAGIAIQNGGSTICALGGFSAIYSGGAYSATPTMYFASTPTVIGITSAVGDRFMKWSTSTNSWTYDSSSARYKDNITDCTYGLDAVLALRPREFDYKFENYKHDVGFVAEEVVDVLPHVVGLDKEGLPEAVMYDRLTSVLCKAIQELNAKVEALEARVAELEAA